jgi:DNA-binding CsgD family transcriptional regulator
MLQSIAFKKLLKEYVGYVPSIAAPLLDAARKTGEISDALNEVIAALGFDTFTCGVSMNLRPNEDSVIHVFTTVNHEWLRVYNERAFIEIDPRVQALLATGLPFIWDQGSLRGKSEVIDAFLDAGLVYGLGSGVAVGFVDRRGHAVTVAFNSMAHEIGERRRAKIAASMGDLVLFAHFFEEVFISTMIEEQVKPGSYGSPLSKRERECLDLAARGQTGDDIAFKLGITPRTVQFHFDSIRSKLNATSRQEAVAKAVQAGVVSGLL